MPIDSPYEMSYSMTIVMFAVFVTILEIFTVSIVHDPDLDLYLDWANVNYKFATE